MLFSYEFLNLNYIHNTQITHSKIFYNALKNYYIDSKMKSHSNEKNERYIKQNFGLKMKHNYITHLLPCKLHFMFQKAVYNIKIQKLPICFYTATVISVSILVT
jgi:hypothetical protein